MAGPSGRGDICLNGPPARHFQKGAETIVLAAGRFEPNLTKDNASPDPSVEHLRSPRFWTAIMRAARGTCGWRHDLDPWIDRRPRAGTARKTLSRVNQCCARLRNNGKAANPAKMHRCILPHPIAWRPSLFPTQ